MHRTVAKLLFWALVYNVCRRTKLYEISYGRATAQGNITFEFSGPRTAANITKLKF